MSSVFRQGYKNKNKVVTDAKAKGRDSPIGTKSAPARTSATLAEPTTIYPEEFHGSENVQNGVSIVDVEMRDVSQQEMDNREAKITLPIE